MHFFFIELDVSYATLHTFSKVTVIIFEDYVYVHTYIHTYILYLISRLC